MSYGGGYGGNFDDPLLSGGGGGGGGGSGGSGSARSAGRPRSCTPTEFKWGGVRAAGGASSASDAELVHSEIEDNGYEVPSVLLAGLPRAHLTCSIAACVVCCCTAGGAVTWVRHACSVVATRQLACVGTATPACALW